MSDLKPLILHGLIGPPNPTKVALVLSELDLPYEVRNYEHHEAKQEPFLSLNPNGRFPALEDPNTDIVLWESGAIIDYLIDTYDKAHKLSYATFPEKHLARCWEHFQMSGQGPYFGQKAWFSRLHPEKVPSAVDRYAAEIRRVTSVLDGHLKRQKEEQGNYCLVGDRVTYADIMFVPWSVLVPIFAAPEMDLSEFEHYGAWLASLVERPAIKNIVDQVTNTYKVAG
ncbi:glutathione S-transferase [Stachybotrys elegans]|uniref:Glutathione S-transferase n=1 Tax=Stachybotrys elegans TaxID=80388 RepID=A0A8K0SGQ6_9HYPO|nr:glutathione S-transferase [Stachybotrys elegans]